MMQPVQVTEEAGAIAVGTTRGKITYKSAPGGTAGTIESMDGQLANYAIARQDDLTDTSGSEAMTTWNSGDNEIWSPAATRSSCFLQSQTALDTSMLPVDPVCGQGQLPEPRAQGLRFVADFCEPLPPVPTPTPSS